VSNNFWIRVVVVVALFWARQVSMIMLSWLSLMELSLVLDVMIFCDIFVIFSIVIVRCVQ
jgi:hypothetical protein